MWQPGKSTVLAVLVSIQAMILGAPLPLLNEPGLAMLGESPEVVEHKRHVQVKTIKFAMIAWLMKLQQTAEETERDIWHDIVEEYWKYNSKNVLDTVEQWSLENSLVKAYDRAAFPSLNMWTGALDQKSAPRKGVKPQTENLAQKLQELILLQSAEEDKSGEESSSKASEGRSLNSSEDSISAGSSNTGGTSISTSSSKGATKTTKKGTNKGKRKESANTTESTKDKGNRGSKRRKTKDVVDDAYDSDSESDVEGLLPHGNFQHHLNDPQEEVGTWVYTGGRTMKEIRDICHAFDVTPARSINDSIARLEDHVNNEAKMDNDLVLKYGKIMKPLN